MRQEQLNRTLRLIRRTGDKALVMDLETDDIFVLMDLDNYEDMLDGLDVPNPDGPDSESPLEDYVLDDLLETPEKKVETAETEPVKPSPEPKIEPEVSQKKAEEPAPEPVIEPIKPLNQEEEALDDVPNDGEEQKFYLEPVE